MKKYIVYILLASLAVAVSVGCGNNSQKSMNNEMNSWKQAFQAQLPLLGHRNWIIITDMAYPLQSAPGITTLYADEDFTAVIAQVKAAIDSMPHVFAHVYHDQEMDYLTDELAPGIGKVQDAVAKLYGRDVQSMPHEEMIAKLDKASRLYQVVIIKTPLQIPYTSLFLELDCKYWDAARQTRLDELMR